MSAAGRRAGTTVEQARADLAAAVAARTAVADAAQAATGRKRAELYRTLKLRSDDVNYCAQRLELAVRAANPGAAEADIQRMARAAR